jgi:diamine N-acetyltransferase
LNLESEGNQITLRPITSKTVRTICDLAVADSQTHLVTGNAISIAEAHFCRQAWFRAICTNKKPVGFIMLYQLPKIGKYYLWRFMIDAKYQRKGYGKKALEIVIESIRKNPKAKALTLSLVRTEGCAEEFYRKFGFEFTGEIKHGQHIMSLTLQ